jgi:hypothetical protein
MPLVTAASPSIRQGGGATALQNADTKSHHDEKDSKSFKKLWG